MKIVIVYDVIYPFVKGGAEKRIFKLAGRLGEKHQIHLMGMKYWEGPDTIQIENYFVHGVCPARNLYNLWGQRNIFEPLYFSWHLFKKLKNFDCDLIDCQNFPYFPAWVCTFWAAVKKKPLVITWLEVWDRYWFQHLGWLQGAGGYLIEKITGRLTDFNSAISFHTARKVRRFLKNKHVRIAPVGINYENISAAEIIPEEKSDLVFAGRLIKEKNVALLLRVVKISRLSLTVVGDGPERLRLEKLAGQLGINHLVKFLGFLEDQNDVYRRLKSARVFVLPSSREGFSTVALEAMAAGLPVVTTRHPDNAARELVEKSGFGRLAELEVLSFIENIMAALNDRELYDKIAAEKAHFLKNYEIDFIARHLENYYLTVREKFHIVQPAAPDGKG